MIKPPNRECFLYLSHVTWTASCYEDFRKIKEIAAATYTCISSFKKPVFRPLWTGLFTSFHGGNNVCDALFFVSFFLLFCFSLLFFFALVAFYSGFFFFLDGSTVLLDTVGKLMVAKNTSNILIYPSQMDFFRLRLEGFSGFALRKPDRIVSWWLLFCGLSISVWFLAEDIAAPFHPYDNLCCITEQFLYTTCLLVVETLSRFPFRVLSTRDSLNHVFRGQGISS